MRYSNAIIAGMTVVTALVSAVNAVNLEWATVSSGAASDDFGLIVNIGEPLAGVASNDAYGLAAGVLPCLGFSPPPPCPEDVNGDGVTNVLDLIELLLCFGQPAVPGCESEDVKLDGSVDVLDLIELLLAFGTSCP